jgi:integrase
MKGTINSSLLSKLSPRDKPYEVRDDKLTGFLVRVNISGKLVYMCEFARGKRVTIGKVGVLTPAQARDKALTILGDVTKGIDPRKRKNKANLTFKEFIELHYEPWVVEHRKSGNKTIKNITRCFLRGTFDDYALADITPVLIDQWRTQRLKNNRSVETVNRDITSLKAALSKAVLWEIIERHPLERLKQLKSDRSVKVRYLSHDEEQRLRDAIIDRELKIKNERNNANQWRRERGYDLLPDLNEYEFADHIRPMILLSLNTGLRQGEVLSLKWENINFERALLTIEGDYAKSGKTRHLPLNSEAMITLETWQKQSTLGKYVFANKKGEPFDNVKKSWAKILKIAKIQNFRWHDMRHHFASSLVMSGVDLNTVRELLGHSDLSMTLRYAHLAPEHKANAVEKLIKKFPSKNYSNTLEA